MLMVYPLIRNASHCNRSESENTVHLLLQEDIFVCFRNSFIYVNLVLVSCLRVLIIVLKTVTVIRYTIMTSLNAILCEMPTEKLYWVFDRCIAKREKFFKVL